MQTKVVLALGNVVPKSSKEDSESTLTITVASLKDLEQNRPRLLKQSLKSLEIWLLSSEVSSVYNDPLELANWIPLLHQTAQLKIILQSSSNEKASLEPIHTSLLLSGLKATSEEHCPSHDIILHVERKARTSTQSRPLQNLNRNKNTEQLNDVMKNVDDDDLIDEDDLLSGNDAFQPPNIDPNQQKKNIDDCGGRQPCDNCTCGRAEGKMPQQEKLTDEELLQKSSACGNCPKGDAFRCASCPFLGKPAFQPGEEHLVLNLVDDL